MNVLKKALKVAGGVVLLLALVAGGGLTWLLVARPRARPPSAETVERTPERLARGTYLAENLLLCMHCHSEHKMDKFGMPLVPGTLGHGGLTIDRSFGLPGVVTPPNITPDPDTGIGAWTDGEIMRAIREGIRRDGRTLFPMMPYAKYRELSDEDTRALVVYLRALPARKHTVPPRELDFPVGLMIRLVPQPLEAPVAAPDPAKDRVAYGAHLVKVAQCSGCHTPSDARGQPLPGLEFAGGREFLIPGPGGRSRSVTANITPDPETGYFGTVTKEGWIARVRAFVAMKTDPPDAPWGTNTMMPWLEYAGLTDEDLGAIYDYMRTVKPVRRHINRFPDAPRAGGAAALAR